MEKTVKALMLIAVLLITSCKEEKKDVDVVTDNQKKVEKQKTTKQLKEELTAKGFEIFDYVDEETKDTVLMQQYFIAFLKRGPNQSQNKAETDSLQSLHLAHLGSMYEQGFADISGPFGDDGDIRGITIYNTPTFEMADSLANMDPMVKAGRLVIEMHPWWAGKGFPLR
ncbi:MAG: YciI family protein [Aurantibacter sp.]